MVQATSERFGSHPLWQQAQALLARKQTAAAHEILPRLRAQVADDDVHPFLLAAQIAWAEDRIQDAAAHVLSAARIAPADIDTLCAIANVLLEAGESVAAHECLTKLPLTECRDPLQLIRAATLHKRLEQHAESLALLDQAEALGNVDPALRYIRGRTLITHGRLTEAETELTNSLASAPDRGSIAVPLVNLRRQTKAVNHLSILDTGARNSSLHPSEQAAFEFARYKTYEDLGRYAEAWQALARGNALMRAQMKDETTQLHAWLDDFLTATSPASPQVEATNGPVPIFIIGMPRSGTTLLERMLANHTQVASVGELVDFRQQVHWIADTRNIFTDAFISRLPDLDYTELGRRYLAQTQWRANGKRFYIDKQPPNWLVAGLIHAALPDAPILNLIRDPVDTCFSNWRAYFGNACAYSYDLGALAAFFNDYARTMVHWRRTMPGAILDVDYAALVSDPEHVLQRVFEFCGLGWEPGCADLTRNAAPSATLSATQIRTDVQRDTASRWLHYAQHLTPLLNAIGVKAQSTTP